jgi:hypothetical protein
MDFIFRIMFMKNGWSHSFGTKCLLFVLEEYEQAWVRVRFCVFVFFLYIVLLNFASYSCDSLIRGITILMRGGIEEFYWQWSRGRWQLLDKNGGRIWKCLATKVEQDYTELLNQVTVFVFRVYWK